MTPSPFYGTAGPHSPRIIVVGEAWGREEKAACSPFVGQSGKELFRMLGEALPEAPELHARALGASSFSAWIAARDEWLHRTGVLLTNLVHLRPEGNELWRLFHENVRGDTAERIRGLRPGPAVKAGLLQLLALLQATTPQLVVACGNYALWALTDCCSASAVPTGSGATVSVPGGITSWRGSMWTATAVSTSSPIRVLPVLHPANILREWYWRTPTVHDLRTRIPLALAGDWRPSPPPNILAPPTFEVAEQHLALWLSRAESGEVVKLACDIETARGLITCIGFAPSTSLALVIPLVRLTEGRGFDSYWSESEERRLTGLIRRVLSHPHVHIIGQNFIYDSQYLIQQMAVRPRLHFDTMLAHHLLFPGTPKGLDYLSSLYCRYHWYWKDDSKEWDLKGSLEQLLVYNGIDLLRTFECAEALSGAITKAGLEEQWRERLELNSLALDIMERGVRIDTSRRSNLALELALSAEQFELWFERILPDAIVKQDVALKGKTAKPWYRSSAQQRAFFSSLGFKLPLNRKTGRESFGKEALRTLAEKHPEFSRLFTALLEYRSIEVFHNTFIRAPLEPNERMKCSFNVAGTETFRWSSSANAFGRGTNLQNIPSGNED